MKGGKGWPATPTVTLNDPGGSPNDFFGGSVAIDGSTITIGAPGNNTFTGAAYIYTKDKHGHWLTSPVATMVDPAGAQYDWFGVSVSVGANTVAAGTLNGNIAYIFLKGKSSWPTTPTVTLADPAGGGTCFGCAVALDENVTLAVGAGPGSAVHLYTNGSSGWPTTPTAILSDPSSGGNNDFGVAVAIAGHNLVVGSDSGPPMFGSIQYEGAGYFYNKGTAGWPANPTTSVADPGSTSGDFFGTSVAIHGTVVVVGARGCPVGCPGTTHPGSAYIFNA